VRADGDLAIGDLAQGARILAGHSDHTTPLLGSPVSSSTSMPSQGTHALLVEGLGFPERIGSQMSEPCGGGPRHTAAMVSQCF
jgi:hypothetical protein